MKLAFEIVGIWTALNLVVGIPVWMLVKLRDRREMFEKGLDWEDSYAGEPNAARSHMGPANPVIPAPALPLVVGAGRLVPDVGSAMLGAVHRAATDNRSVADV